MLLPFPPFPPLFTAFNTPSSTPHVSPSKATNPPSKRSPPPPLTLPPAYATTTTPSSSQDTSPSPVINSSPNSSTSDSTPTTPATLSSSTSTTLSTTQTQHQPSTATSSKHFFPTCSPTSTNLSYPQTLLHPIFPCSSPPSSKQNSNKTILTSRVTRNNKCKPQSTLNNNNDGL